MANLLAQGVLMQISNGSVTLRIPGVVTENSYTVNQPLDPNILPGASVVQVFDDGSVVRIGGDNLPDT